MNFGRNLVFMGVILINAINANSQGFDGLKETHEMEKNSVSADSILLPRNPYKITVTYSNLLNKVYWVFQPLPFTNNYNTKSNLPQFNHHFHIHLLSHGLGNVFKNNENTWATSSVYIPHEGNAIIRNKYSYFRFTGVPLPHKSFALR